MLYQMLRPAPKPEPPPMHYLDSAELLHRLQAEGYSRADMARIAGVNVQQAAERLRLLGLDEGLRAYLRQEGVPERIALTLLTLPDPVTRRRMAHRIVREHLCIRDAALLVHSAYRRCPRKEAHPPAQRVITVMRDVRLYRNAVRDIAEQMKTAGVRATFSERRTGGMQELTIAYPARRRRTERYQSI